MSTEVADAGNTEAFVIDFIDPLFAVAVHLGISESIATRTWFHEGRWPSGDEWFSLSVFLLGFLTLVWSWVGYHKSIQDKPLKGLARFVLDVVLVTLYAVVLLQVENFGLVLSLLASIYGFFVLWDLGKIREYPKRFSSSWPWSLRNPREFVTCLFFLAFAVLALLYGIEAIGNWVGLGLAALLTIAYRLGKDRPPWRWFGQSHASSQPDTLVG
jgi:hypothetical protein